MLGLEFTLNLNCINNMLAIVSLAIQVAVILYGIKMYLMIRPVRYWTMSWLLYSIAHTLIFFRRILSWTIRENFLPPAIPKETLELSTQIVISIVFLFSAYFLSKMYSKYFQNGVKVPSWKEEKTADNKRVAKNKAARERRILQ